MSRAIDEMELMAYVDGELDAGARAAVEAAAAADPRLAARLHAEQALRSRLQGGLAGELAEPVPERLQALLRPTVQAQPQVQRDGSLSLRVLGGWGWFGGPLLGLLIALALLRGGSPAQLLQQDGRLMAGGTLAQALDQQLASAAPAAVAVPVSFVATDGRYCRSFTLERSAGLACRAGSQWEVQTLAAAEPQPGGALRQAATPLPPAVLAEIERRMGEGSALDASAEKAARDRGWRR